MTPLTLEDVPSTGTERSHGFWDSHDAGGNPIGGVRAFDLPVYPPPEIDVRQLMRDRGLTPSTLAPLLGIPATEIYALVRGAKRPTCGWAEAVRRLDEVER